MSTTLREAANDYVAAELRAELARKRMSERELARRMDVDQAWIWKRLSGTVPLRLGEAIDIAHELELSLPSLIESAIKRRFSHKPSDLRFYALAGAS